MRQINTVLKPLGLAITREKTVKKASQLAFLSSSYRRTLEDFENLFRGTLFPMLPQRNNRHDLMMRLRGNPVAETLYILGYLHLSLDLPGDVCEFGVAEGTNSALLANEILDYPEKKLWLFDSFQGLPKPTEKDKLIDDIFELGEMDAYEGHMAHPTDSVKRRLNEIKFPKNRTAIIEGFIEKTMSGDKLPEKVCFAYVDFDFYEPTKVALELLHPRLSVGSHVVVDDYGYFSEGAKTATDEFVKNSNGKYQLILPHEFTKGFAIIAKTTK